MPTLPQSSVSNWHDYLCVYNTIIQFYFHYCLDYPTSKLTIVPGRFNAPFLPFNAQNRLLTNVQALDGQNGRYNGVTYAPAFQSCSTSTDTCGSGPGGALWCDTDARRCAAKANIGSRCTNNHPESCYAPKCRHPKCVNSICIC